MKYFVCIFEILLQKYFTFFAFEIIFICVLHNAGKIQRPMGN